ncbi:hypothetical protein AB0939_02805 [Streptomyces sp. NPDC006990]|uniref:hypothetical protein n=1 Tax=Streptomyces sp. NPDC006990 TaxID=3154481 RepID=UPI0034526C36
MGLFNRTKDDTTPADPAMVELGRDYAIAKRHGDRKTVNRITHEIGHDALSDADRAAFHQGKDSYDAIPPAHSKRPNRR